MSKSQLFGVTEVLDNNSQKEEQGLLCQSRGCATSLLAKAPFLKAEVQWRGGATSPLVIFRGRKKHIKN